MGIRRDERVSLCLGIYNETSGTCATMEQVANKNAENTAQLKRTQLGMPFALVSSIKGVMRGVLRMSSPDVS